MRFDSYHPVINFIYFLAAICFTILFHHPIFLGIAYISSFVYAIKLRGIRGLIFQLCMIPAMAVYAILYSGYTHFGVTIIGKNFAGNDMTLESLVFGWVIALTAASVIQWISCLLAVVSSDKIVYLFGRVSPKLSLFLSIILRSVPQVMEAGRRIGIAQSGIGKGAGQGNVFVRIMHACRQLSILITWVLDSFMTTAESMKSRGYSLRGRTAFSIYRFDNRDRSLVIAFFFCLTLIGMAMALDQTNIIYDPEIIMNRITVGSYVFYAAYAVFLLLPLSLQIIGEQRYARLAGRA